MRTSTVLGFGICLLVSWSVASAEGPSTTTRDGRAQLIAAQIAAGEFGPALQTAQSAPDVSEQSHLLSLVAQAQIKAGEFGAALGSVRQIPDAEARRTGRVDRAKALSLEGGTGADFDSLINLIQEQTEGPWEEIDGIGGTITEYEAGVRVNPHGLLHHLSKAEQNGRLAALGLEAREASLNDDMARPSQLRMVSLTRLERSVAERLETGKPVAESMAQLAGLTEIQYLFVYPEGGEIVIAGPAEAWQHTVDGMTVGVSSEQPTLHLDDLVTVLRTFSHDGMQIFGCSINPRQEGLKELKQFVEASQAKGPLSSGSTRFWAKQLGEKLGRQDIEIYGVPADSRAARVIVEADYRMKLIGIGKLSAGPHIPNYFDLVAAEPQAVTGSIDALRWWLSMKYQNVLHSDDHNAFEIRGSSVLCQSENQFLADNGQRIQTGKSEPLNQLFAAKLTQHYDELATQVPVFADLQNVFDLALVAALIQHERVDDRLDWDRGVFATNGLYHPASHMVPLECESVVNHRVYGGKDVVVQVAGGVRADLLSVVREQMTESPRVSNVANDAQPPQLPEGRWWWDVK